jgi:protein TonB
MMNNDISRLRKNRVVNFKLGLITSLSFVIMAFNFTSHPFTESIHEGCTLKFDDEEVKIERTSQRKTPPLPEVNISDHIEKGPEPFFIDPFEGDIDEIEPEVEEPIDFLVEEPVRDFAEYMPSFGICNYSEMSKDEYKACSDAALIRYFAKHIKYPTIARENRIEGRVILRFVIDANGDVQNAKVLRGVSGGCSEEALRVLKNMPKWKAGRHSGRNVKVNFTLPVTFKLQ